MKYRYIVLMLVCLLLLSTINVPAGTAWSNHDPVNNDPSPGDAEGDVSLPITNFSIRLSDKDDGNQTVNVTFRGLVNGSWADLQTNASAATTNDTFFCLNTSWIMNNSQIYTWSVNTSDGYTHFGWDNDTYTFQTNILPVNSAPFPANGATGIDLDSKIRITLNDGNGHTMNQTFWTDVSGTWNQIAFNNDTANASLTTGTEGFMSYSTTYTWSSNTTDGYGQWDNDTYTFTTKGSPSSPGGAPTVYYTLTVRVIGDDATVSVYYYLTNTLFETEQIEAGGSHHFMVTAGSYRVEAVADVALEQLVQIMGEDKTITFDFTDEGLEIVPGISIPGFEFIALIASIGIAFIVFRKNKEKIT